MSRRGARRLASGAGLALALAWLGVFGASELRLERTWPAAPAALSVRPKPQAAARGRHLGEAVAQCAFCHGDDLSGRPLADDPWVGRLWAPNLTSGRGGLPPETRDADLVRAIRDGVARDGRSLRLMPSDQLRAMGDADLAAVIAWVRSAEPVDASRPPAAAGPLTRLALVSGLAPELLAAERIDSAAPPEPPPPAGATPAYGAYLVSIGICRTCHRDDLTGGLHPLALPGEPPPPDLTASGALRDWSEADFVTTLRSGTSPDGRRLDPEHMPWPRYAQMSDLELRAVFSYLATLP